MRHLNQLFEKIWIFARYYWRAETIYRIHSPYIYDLIQSVFDQDSSYYDFRTIHQAYHQTISSNDVIPSNPFGVERQQTGQNLGKFANKALSHLSRLFELYRLVYYIKPKRILELGSCLGVSTLTMGIVDRKASLTGVEGNPYFAKNTSQLLQSHKLKHATIKLARFNEFLEEHKNERYDFIFLDGDHTFESTCMYVQQLLKLLNPKGIILMDDIHWSKDMYRAWNVVKNYSGVRSSLELIRWGILFTDESLTPGPLTYIPYPYKFWQIGLFK